QNPAIVAFDRTAMLAGTTATAQMFNPGNFYATILPADLDGPTLPPTGAQEPLISATGNNTVLHLWKLHIDWANPGNSVLNGPTNLAAAPWDPSICPVQDCIPQPGTTQRLDALADHMMFRLAYRNFGNHESMVTNETVNVGGGQAGVRWYEIRNPSTSPYIYQQGSYAPDTSYRWMGSAAMDRDGDIAVG